MIVLDHESHTIHGAHEVAENCAVPVFVKPGLITHEQGL